MKFVKATPKVSCLNSLEHFRQFLHLGQYEFCDFLKKFLNLEEVRIQSCDFDDLKEWLKVESFSEVMEVPEDDNEICVVSQIQTNGELIAYFPYVLRGKGVKKYLKIKSFLPKLSEAVSDQITSCYLQDFKGGDWIFGENLARMIVSNCISTRKYDGIKFAHLIEKMEQLAASTFEGEFFSTGVIVCSDSSKYKENYFEFTKNRDIDNLDKREWFLANGQESFFLLDSNTNSRGIFRKSMPSSTDFIARYFKEYYLSGDLMAPDFIVRTVGPNEISISDSDCKEFVKVENVWKYRHQKNITQFLVDKLEIDYKVSKQEDFSIIEKMNICEEGELRYKYQIAPGYTDAEKENDKNDFTRKYGDLIIWKEILKRVSGTCMNVIFVQDEKKQDWLAQKGGNVLAPVLLEEYQSATNNTGKIEVCDFIGFLENYGEAMGLPVSKVEELTELLRFERRVYQYIVENMHEISQNKIEEFLDERYSFYEVANQITWNSVYGGSFEDADDFEIDDIDILASTIYYEKNIKICTINSKFVVHGRAEIKEYISREVSYSGNVELDLTGEIYMDIIIDYSDTAVDSDSAYEVANVDIRVSDITWDNASEYSMDVKYD